MIDDENHLDLDELQSWCESGKSLYDGAFSLLFRAAYVAEVTQGLDVSLPLYMDAANILIQATIAEELHLLRKTIERGMK